ALIGTPSAASTAPPPSRTTAAGPTCGALASSSTAARQTRVPVIARDSLGPARCGRPRTPVAASAAVSGTVLAKCAATPSSALAAITPGGGHGPPGPAVVTTAGSAPKENA